MYIHKEFRAQLTEPTFLLHRLTSRTKLVFLMSCLGNVNFNKNKRFSSCVTILDTWVGGPKIESYLSQHFTFLEVVNGSRDSLVV
jgi:hypothetical protein